MNDKEKINKLDALEQINERIGSCFGEADKLFARHNYDEERAKEFRKLAKENNVQLKEIMNAICGYLYRTNFHYDHIKKEYEIAEKFFSKDLS